MRKIYISTLLAFVFLSVKLQAQTHQTKTPSNSVPKTFNVQPPSVMSACSNIDFENGSYSSWTLTSGNINNVAIPCNLCTTTAGGIAAVTTNTSTGATWTNGVDKYSLLPVVAPNGGVYSLALNNATPSGKMMKLSQTLSVDASNALFTYQYLVVLQSLINPHHIYEQPYFSALALDASGNVIACTQSVITTSVAANGWQTSSVDNSVAYLPWTTAVMDLTAYIGQNVTVEFIVTDCSLGGHFGYAYVDASCSAPQISTQGSTFCQGVSSITLNAPAGYTSYNWSGPWHYKRN